MRKDRLDEAIERADRERAERNGHTNGHTAQPFLVLRTLDSIAPVRVRTIWKHRVFFGKPVVLAGLPGIGKSFVAGAIVAAITRGLPPPGGGELCAPADVIVLSLEDDPASVLRPRYEALGADLRRVHILDGVQRDEGERIAPFSATHIALLEAALDERPEVRVIVVDPIMSLLSNVDTFRSNDVRQVIDPFFDMLEERDVAPLLIAHVNKDSKSSGIMRIEASLGGFVGRARTVLAAGRIQESGRRAVGVLKSNLGPDGESVPLIVYDIDETGRFTWVGESGEATPAELFDPPKPRHKADPCATDLLDILGDGDWHTAESLLRSLKAKNYTLRTIERARAEQHDRGAIQRRGGGGAGPVFWAIAEATHTPSHNGGEQR